MSLRSVRLPREVLVALQARNPFHIHWSSSVPLRRYEALVGLERETAGRLLDALTGFPPDAKRYDLTDVVATLEGGYRVTVATGTHVRMTVVAEYDEFYRIAEIIEFRTEPRRIGRLRNSEPKKGR